MRYSVFFLLLLAVTFELVAQPGSVTGKGAADRSPSDAYGGGNSLPQPLTQDEAKEIYRIPVPIADGPFDGTWDSFTPDKLQAEPNWWRDAKIGIWFHWGPQSMGRNGDWYARFLYQQPPEGRKARANNLFMYDVHNKRFGHPSEFGYMDVLNAWKAPDFDPKKLMDLYASCGARYILVQGAHHDNFDLWDSKFQPWNSVNVGPKRDIVGEMFTEARKHDFRVGMAFHADYSLWWFQPAFGSDKVGSRAGVPYDAATRTKESGKGKWWAGLDPKDLYGIDLQSEALPDKNIRDGFFTPVRDLFVYPDTRAFAKEYCLKWFNRLKQFIDDYDPDFLYTDGTEPFTGRGTAKGVVSDATPKIVSHMYNKRYAKNNGLVDCMAVIKGGPKITGVAHPHEGGYLGPVKRTPWVWEDTVGEWFFEENTFYSTRPMVLQMIEAISRDGNFNINISLTPEGVLEPGGEKMWREFGEFLKINGSAIYGSSAWKIIGEGRPKTDPQNAKDPQPFICFPNDGILPGHDKFPMTTQDIRFTQGKDGAVYAFVMAVPEPGETITIQSLGSAAKLLDKPITDVSLLGSKSKIKWEQTSQGLMIKCPSQGKFQFAVVFRIR